MFSPFPDKCSTVADLILDSTHPGADDVITKESLTQLYIPDHIPPSTSFFIRGLCIAESIQLYVSGMLPPTLHRVKSIIADNDTPVHLTSIMPSNSAKEIGNIVANNSIAPLTQFKEDLPLNVASCMISQPLPAADAWTSAYEEDGKICLKHIFPSSS